MNDLEITELCAKAMKLRYKTHEDNDDVNYNFIGVYLYNSGSNMWNDSYNPLLNDEQLMALIKNFPQQCLTAMWNELKRAASSDLINEQWPDFNRAVCESIAVMMHAKYV